MFRDSRRLVGFGFERPHAARETNQPPTNSNDPGDTPRLCVKGTKTKALTPGQKRENRKKSRTRARVEHVFGHQAHLMKADFIRTIGMMRATMQIGLGNLVYNFIRVAEIKAAAE